MAVVSFAVAQCNMQHKSFPEGRIQEQHSEWLGLPNNNNNNNPSKMFLPTIVPFPAQFQWVPQQAGYKPHKYLIDFFLASAFLAIYYTVLAQFALTSDLFLGPIQGVSPC